MLAYIKKEDRGPNGDVGIEGNSGSDGKGKWSKDVTSIKRIWSKDVTRLKSKDVTRLKESYISKY